MTDQPIRALPWRRSMTGRDPGEEHRSATPLELFFDLCFVGAVAQAAVQLEHALASGHVATGLGAYLLVFLAIWWAWMNFTWFATAYDTDDVPYRLCTMVVMAGALVLAAGVAPAFEHLDFRAAFAGYAVMRLGLEALRLRAAFSHPEGRTTMLRYAAGESAAMVGWAVVIFALPRSVMIFGWLVMAAVELLVPIWAERTARWHADHIAERYGLFTIIVLGEVILSSSNAVGEGLAEGVNADLLLVAGGGLLTVFGLWWMYFSLPAAGLLVSLRQAVRWGYGHYVIFASGAAVGAGIAVNIAVVSHHAEISSLVAGAAFTVPVAAYLVMVWLLQIRPHGANAPASWVIPLTGLLVLGATFTPAPVPVTGLLLALLVVAGVVLHATKGSPDARAQNA